MKNMKVKSEVSIYEIDDEELKIGGDETPIVIRSHWNRDEFVVIEIGGKRYTVLAQELKKAVEQCTNTKIF